MIVSAEVSRIILLEQENRRLAAALEALVEPELGLSSADRLERRQWTKSVLQAWRKRRDAEEKKQ